MELQISPFWILKVHSMINSAIEYEPGTLYVKPYANEQKCKHWRQQRSPYRLVFNTYQERVLVLYVSVAWLLDLLLKT